MEVQGFADRRFGPVQRCFANPPGALDGAVVNGAARDRARQVRGSWTWRRSRGLVRFGIWHAIPARGVFPGRVNRRRMDVL